MAEALFVDTSRLRTAAAELAGVQFPTLPPPVAASGSDPVSAAINDTLPVIEAPVLEGLPVVEAALTRTASSLHTAAGRYAQTDESLAVELARQFSLDGAPAGVAVAGVASDGAEVDWPGFRDTPPSLEEASARLTRTVWTAAAALSVAQGVGETIVGGVQGIVSTTSSTTSSAPRPVAHGDDGSAEAEADGAASGSQQVEIAPTQAHHDEQPATTPRPQALADTEHRP